MTASEKPLLDLYQKILVIRSKKELPKDDDKNKSKAGRKKINLPVTDCVNDPTYERDLLANYKVPSSYVRYVRRVGNEADMSVDYNVDEDDKEWMTTHPVLSTDKDCRRQLNADSFEAIINILEHHTAFSREPIPQAHADKLVAEAFGWSSSLSTKVLPALYQYWLKKRATLKKPLCRPYWPQTPAADQHPHLTFRPRAAEKYRLRRQHRKNDLESFRKMKQLKSEFGRAYDLLCLVMERESLREAELFMQQEVFEQTLFDIDRSIVDSSGGSSGTKGSSSSSAATVGRKQRRLEPYAYNLTYEELLREPEPPSAVTASLYGGIKGHAVPSSVQHKHQLAEEARRQQKRNRELQVAQRKKREGEQVLAAQQAADVAAPVPVFYSAYDHQRALEENALQHVHANVPGPRTACRPRWPHFLSDSVARQSLPAGQSTHGYVELLRDGEEALLLASASAAAVSGGSDMHTQDDHHYNHRDGEGNDDDDDDADDDSHHNDNSSSSSSSAPDLWSLYGLGSRTSRIGNSEAGIMGRLQTAGGGADADAARVWLASQQQQHQEQQPPRIVGMRCRGRVGRGGRLVVDRFPLYEADTVANGSSSSSSSSGGGAPTGSSTKSGSRVAYLQPTMLQPATRPFAHKQQAKPTAAEGAAVAASSSSSGAASDTTSAAAGTAGLPPAASAPAPASASASAPGTTSGAGTATAAATTAAAAAAAVKLKAPTRELVLVPPTHPPERAGIAPHFASREQEYYLCSDSEGEETYVPALVKRRGLGGAVGPYYYSSAGAALGGDGLEVTGGSGGGSGATPRRNSNKSGGSGGSGAAAAAAAVTPGMLDININPHYAAAARGMGLFGGVGAVPVRAAGVQHGEKFRLVV